MISHSESELLTVEQFAQRFQVSRTTVFGWLKNGYLLEGIHYIRLGRILRFRWPFFIGETDKVKIDMKLLEGKKN